MTINKHRDEKSTPYLFIQPSNLYIESICCSSGVRKSCIL